MLYAVLYMKKLYNLKKNLYGNFSLERFLYEGCLAGKFQPNRFLNFRFLYAGFNVVQAAMVERTVNGHKGSQGTRGFVRLIHLISCVRREIKASETLFRLLLSEKN